MAISSAADLKRVTLELGGNDAAIVFDDVDVPSVAATLVGLAFFNTGQACALPEADLRRRQHLRRPRACARCRRSDQDRSAERPHVSQLGPLSTGPQFTRVKELVADRCAQGLRPVAGGSAIDGPGYFFQPTILARPATVCASSTRSSSVRHYRSCGLSDLDDALHPCQQQGRLDCAARRGPPTPIVPRRPPNVECGTTFVNTHAALQYDVQFGGSKWSGVGVENGVPGLLSFTQQQVVHRSRR